VPERKVREVRRWGGTQLMEDERKKDESKPRILSASMCFLFCGMQCFKKELGCTDTDILLGQFQIKGIHPLPVVLIRNAFNNVPKAKPHNILRMSYLFFGGGGGGNTTKSSNNSETDSTSIL
jgi:hypothetical protein